MKPFNWISILLCVLSGLLLLQCSSGAKNQKKQTVPKIKTLIPQELFQYYKKQAHDGKERVIVVLDKKASIYTLSSFVLNTKENKKTEYTPTVVIEPDARCYTEELNELTIKREQDGITILKKGLQKGKNRLYLVQSSEKAKSTVEENMATLEIETSEDMITSLFVPDFFEVTKSDEKKTKDISLALFSLSAGKTAVFSVKKDAKPAKKHRSYKYKKKSKKQKERFTYHTDWKKENLWTYSVSRSIIMTIKDPVLNKSKETENRLQAEYQIEVTNKDEKAYELKLTIKDWQVENYLNKKIKNASEQAVLREIGRAIEGANLQYTYTPSGNRFTLNNYKDALMLIQKKAGKYNSLIEKNFPENDCKLLIEPMLALYFSDQTIKKGEDWDSTKKLFVPPLGYFQTTNRYILKGFNEVNGHPCYQFAMNGIVEKTKNRDDILLKQEIVWKEGSIASKAYVQDDLQTKYAMINVLKGRYDVIDRRKGKKEKLLNADHLIKTTFQMQHFQKSKSEEKPEAKKKKSSKKRKKKS